ncbi:MAG: oligosaccharide flippase family protein, partial [Ginsengibacter sp.]
YGSMMVISFLWGQKDYRIPYAWKKLSAYIVIVVLLFFIHEAITYFFKGTFVNLSTATLLLLLYVWFIMTVERNELQRTPIIKKFLPVTDK